MEEDEDLRLAIELSKKEVEEQQRREWAEQQAAQNYTPAQEVLPEVVQLPTTMHKLPLDLQLIGQHLNKVNGTFCWVKDCSKCSLL